MRRAEASLLRPTLLGLLRLGWANQMTLADVEIRWHQKSVDLGFIRVRTDTQPVAIELKVDSTRRAIEQAALNRLLTPESWVATWTAPGSSLREAAAREGVGLLLVMSDGVYPILHPASGEPYTDALRIALVARRRRVRDLLSNLKANERAAA